MDKDGPKKDDASRRVRKHIQEAMEKSEEERRQELMKRRIALATEGIANFKAKKIQEAVLAFRSYLRILEEIKGVSAGGLNPGLFDKKKDLPELLLLSGVYWDLARLYDRTKTSGKRQEFLMYMEKFILFSKGMPFQHICAETLRRYISAKRCVHKDDFKNAYKLLGESKCFIAGALVDEIEEDTLPTLRKYRDDYLMHRMWGRAFVATYYRVAPGLADVVERAPEPVRQKLALGVDWIAKKSKR